MTIGAVIKTHEKPVVLYGETYLDLPKDAESMIRGAHIPSLGFKQHPLEHAGIFVY